MPDPEELVRGIARGIERGEVMTYGEIARIAGLSPRHLGRIVDDIPWWRVIRADGTPAACHGGSAPEILRREGVRFVGVCVGRNALGPAAPDPR